MTVSISIVGKNKVFVVVTKACFLFGWVGGVRFALIVPCSVCKQT